MRTTTWVLTASLSIMVFTMSNVKADAERSPDFAIGQSPDFANFDGSVDNNQKLSAEISWKRIDREALPKGNGNKASRKTSKGKKKNQGNQKSKEAKKGKHKKRKNRNGKNNSKKGGKSQKKIKTSRRRKSKRAKRRKLKGKNMKAKSKHMKKGKRKNKWKSHQRKNNRNSRKKELKQKLPKQSTCDAECMKNAFFLYKRYTTFSKQARLVTKIKRLLSNKLDNTGGGTFSGTAEMLADCKTEGCSPVRQDVASNNIINTIDNCTNSAAAYCKFEISEAESNRVENCPTEYEQFISDHEACMAGQKPEPSPGCLADISDVSDNCKTALNDVFTRLVAVRNTCINKELPGSFSNCRQNQLSSMSLVQKCAVCKIQGTTTETTATTASTSGTTSSTTSTVTIATTSTTTSSSTPDEEIVTEF